jgi:pilus assembly protein CpaB
MEQQSVGDAQTHGKERSVNMNQKNRRGLLIVVVAVLAAVASAALVYSAITSGPRPQAHAQSIPDVAAAAPGKKAVVALRDIDVNVVITTSMLTTVQFPANLVPSDAITNTRDLVGVAAKTKLYAGQMLFMRQFLAGGQPGLSATIPKDKVLVAFPSTDILNSTGALRAGDHVDILLSLPISGTTRLDSGSTTGSQEAGAATTLVSQTTLQNIEVYSNGAVVPPDQAVSQGNTAGPKVITFLVDPQEALILKFVKDSGGVIDLIIRSLEATQVNATDPVSIDYLVDLYRFISLPKK